MNFLNAFKNSLVVTVTATVLVTVLAAMLAYYIVRNVNVFSNIIFALMVASMIIPFQAIMIPLVSVYGGTLNILNHRLTLIFMHTGFSMAMSVFMVPRIHPRKYPAGAGGGRLHRRLYPHPDLLPHRVPAVKADHFHHGNHECDGILGMTSAAVPGADRPKSADSPLSTYSFYGTYSADYGTIMAGLLLASSRS